MVGAWRATCVEPPTGYEQAATQGVVEAQYNLGTFYSVGLGVEKNEQAAADWLRRAAEKGLTEAQYNLGVLYEHGRGVRLDGDAALEWYSRAAKKGYAPAKERLSKLSQKLGVQTVTLTDSETVGNPSVVQSDEGTLESGFAGLRSNEWIAALDPERFTLQLMSQSSEPRAIGFIEQRELHREAAYFVWEKDGTVWYSIIYGLYDSFEQASAVGASLPAVIADVQPWVRNIGAIHELIDPR